MSFADLGLKPEILRAIDEVGYTTPTPIQAQAIPIVLQSRDVLGIAQTGTGKTAGFTLPMIEILANGRARARMPRSVILEPTRELAAQVAENFELYGKYEKLNFALLIGGESLDEQVRKLDRGVDVLIATPGRLLDLVKRGKVLLQGVKILVIDEADRMLDMGFIPDIEEIVSMLPPIRQTLLFSATMPKEIRRLAERFLSNPKQISVERTISPAATVTQHIVFVDKADKRAALRALLRSENVKNALIFCNRKRDVTTVFRSLLKHGFDAGELHGDMVQSARTEMLERFKKGDIRIVVCSDVAARGIDISDLSHVFNFDIPTSSDDYIHRIGRTGRAGKSGRAFSLASFDDAKYVDAIGHLEGINLIPAIPDGVEPLASSQEEFFANAADDRPSRGRGKGGRKPGASPSSKTSGSQKAAPGKSAGRPTPRDQDADAPESASPTAPQEHRDSSPAVAEGNARPRGERKSAAGSRQPRARAVKETSISIDPVTQPGGRVDGATVDTGPTSGSGVGTDNTGGSVRRRDTRRDDDDVVIGMGDHIPAFLLRPVPKSGRK